jgi:uroporphyrinogen-III synthase
MIGGIAVVQSYILQVTTTTSFRTHRRTAASRFLPSPSSLRSSNDDDDDDVIDRDMGRIGWGRTTLSEALLETTTLTDEYVLPEYMLDEEYTTTRPMVGQDDAEVTASDTAKVTIGIALTREVGKNEVLASAITSCAQLMQENQYNVELVTHELPCIQHADGPDYDTFKEILYQQATNTMATIFDYVVVTSPEAARVVASAWPWNKNNDGTVLATLPPKVAAVGKATESTLRDAGIEVNFVPSKATAQTLVQELLPISSTSGDRKTNVLYPASAKAADVILDGLENRTLFTVLRLDTYDTIATRWDTTQQALAQQQCQIVCFASPSAIKGWLSNIDNNNNASTEEDVVSDPNRYVAACIGETSATACRNLLSKRATRYGGLGRSSYGSRRYDRVGGNRNNSSNCYFFTVKVLRFNIF